MDPLKVKYTNPVQTIRLVVHEEGAKALFGGLPAAVMRAGTIYATRLSIYEPVLGVVSGLLGRDPANLDVKIIAAMPVSVVSMVLANPWDVIKVRYQRRPDVPEWSIDPRMIKKVIQNEVPTPPL